MTETEISGKFYLDTGCEGEVIKTRDPMNFWGGYDPAEGRVIDGRNEACGRSVTGKIFVFPEGVGSSTTAAVLLESVKTLVDNTGIGPEEIESVIVYGHAPAVQLGTEFRPPRRRHNLTSPGRWRPSW